MKNLGKIEHKEKRAIGITKEPLRCDDDAFMVRECIRKPILSLNSEMFIKSDEEKHDLSKMRKICTEPQGKSICIKESFEYAPLKLVVYCANPKKLIDLKTTHSFQCFKSEIEDILSDLRDEKYVIKKVYYNNHSYKF